MKFFLISLFSCVWFLAVGQQEENKKSENEDNIFVTPVSHMPIFGTCINDSLSYQEMKKCSDEEFVDFFYGNLKFPTVPFEKLPKQKKAVVQFIIHKDGSISDIKFRRVKIPKVYEDEIIRVLELMPCWRPGMMMGEILDLQFTLPVKMPDRLEDCLRVAEQMPIFEGCENEATYQEQRKCSDQKLMNFFSENFRFPKGIQPCTFYFRMLMRWKVKKDGSISNVLFLRPTHETLEKEILRIIDLMPKWKPAMHQGEPVELCFTFPFKVHLQ